MALARDLLSQARQLAYREPKRPKQASLRRAVSTAYYALFHLLVDAAAREVVSGNDAEALRGRVARACDHNSMKKLCHAVANWDARQPPQALAEVMTHPPSDALRQVARAFADLQQARHEADYDLNRRFSRDHVGELLGKAERAFSAFEGLDRRAWERRVFVLGVVFHGRWNRA
ncbi:hypothetical protein KBTX_01960 [wastewater metagenome]|uniref:HEPN domain-containing protein n=2 Tax=unclassified sequences TaxID=12908 RepID=A0A5B8RG23_9ZZZZ|nr:hypothetical protein [Arhodomonas sp. KWT]QEA05637.1 hypothetical protein KBTEX_01960 [uncultured organism]